MKPDLYILNGPNLNLLGSREPEVYGKTTLQDLENMVTEAAKAEGYSNIHFRQSNHEGELVEWIQEAGLKKSHVIFNPGGYTHTSIAIHDAIKGTQVALIEVHISNIFARESFRQHSYVSPLAKGTICGLGTYGYILALKAFANA